MRRFGRNGLLNGTVKHWTRTRRRGSPKDRRVGENASVSSLENAGVAERYSPNAITPVLREITLGLCSHAGKWADFWETEVLAKNSWASKL